MATTQEIRELLADATAITAGEDDKAAVNLVYRGVLDQPAKSVASARLLCTAHGIYEACVNGTSVDDSVLSPGWTAYEWRLQVKDVDVTELVRGRVDGAPAGEDRAIEIDVLLGNGWYRGKFGFDKQQSDYGSELAFLCTLVIAYQDGAEQVISTNMRDWRAFASPVTYNNLYNGEHIDARIAPRTRELPLREAPLDRETLIAQEGPVTRRFETFTPCKIWTSPTGKTLVDFGQNLVGWIRFEVTGERGSVIQIRHAEVIEDGELGVRPLREAKATDVYTLSGERDAFEPTLTFHGFRYAEVTGWPGELRPSDLTAVAIRSDIAQTGWFTCSNSDVNQLVSNALWSQRGNFVDIPTDCPQRDEREGWTGDIAAFAPTACFQHDCRDFLHKWLMDLRVEAEHTQNATVPIVIPDVLKLAGEGNWKFMTNETAIWGDAATWVPQALWNAYGDSDALASHYPAMCLHLRTVEEDLSPEGLWNEGFQFGDWLDPSAPPNDPAAAKADRYVIAQACLYRSVRFAAEAARVLGKQGDAEHWESLAARAKEAFGRHYVDAGRVKSDAAAAYALAIHFGLLDGEDRKRAAARLAELVREAGYRVSTGFAGTPYVTWALSETGYASDAYRLLLERECPSWMYPVSMGATTIWERWDSMLPSGKINPGGMTSFNHYALGAVCDWIYQVVGGIRPAAPGYAKVLVKPVPGEGIDWARCAYDSVHGRIEVSWKVTGGELRLSATVPAGVQATVELPDGSTYEVSAGTHHFGCPLPSE